MTAGSIRTRVTDWIGRIEIHRPEKRNALTPELCDDLSRAVRTLDRDPGVRVIALSGADRDFSAGADIAELSRVLFDDDPRFAEVGTTYDHLTATDNAFTGAHKPTVALVQGICMGGGWQLASSCDVILCSDDARLAITPALLGIVYPRVGIARLVRMVGATRAKHLLFSGTRIQPADAERWGLVTELLPAASFHNDAEAFLRRIASNSQLSVQLTKQLIDAGTGRENTDTSALDSEWGEIWKEMPENPDLAAGRAAFLAGDTPEFVWARNA